MSGRVREAIDGVPRQLVPQEGRHQARAREGLEREQAQPEVILPTRDAPFPIRRWERGVEVHEEIESDLVGPQALQGVEVLVDIDQFFHLDVQPALLVELARHAGGQGLPEFQVSAGERQGGTGRPGSLLDEDRDRKSTRLNSSHEWISYS